MKIYANRYDWKPLPITDRNWEEDFDDVEGRYSKDFEEQLENMVRRKFDVVSYTNDVEGKDGGEAKYGPNLSDHVVNIELSDGSEYEFRFDWYNEDYAIYTKGPHKAAQYYYLLVHRGIRTNSARV